MEKIYFNYIKLQPIIRFKPCIGLDLGSPEGHEPEGGQGLGHEGKPVRIVELPQRRLGQTVHEALADLGEEVRSDPDVQGWGDALPPPGQHPDLLPASDHQRRGRRPQQQDHGIKRRACGTGTESTSRPPSISSAAAWTFIPSMHEHRYPCKTRKDRNKMRSIQ